jgi:hypothetical protein
MVIPPETPEIDEVVLSVAVIVDVPAVVRVAWKEADPFARVLSAGRTA